MESKIFVAVECIVKVENEKYSLYPAVIRNLYKIQNELNRQIVIIYDGKKQKKVFEKFIPIFNNEQIKLEDLYPVKDTKQYFKSNAEENAKVILPDDWGKEMNLSTEQKIAKPSDDGILWDSIFSSLKKANRKATVQRNTNETQIVVTVDLDAPGEAQIHTGLGFFDHMLEQVARHGQLGLKINVHGDLHIDEHHTIEDTALALGAAFKEALGNKIGIERYGFLLPMDDCLAQVAIDFGGRPWLVWEANFKREKVGDMPTEMFYHFFKSFSDAAACNLNIKADGENEHHKIEAIFKAFAKAIKMANTATGDNTLPSTKGVL